MYREEEKRYSIAIAMPVQDAVCAQTAFDLANMVAWHQRHFMDEITMLVHEGTMLVSQRLGLVVSARRELASHILFIDSDMRFPVDALSRLLMAECRVVGCNCAKRRMPTGPTAANYDSKGRRIPVYTTPETGGLEQVDSVGTGFLLCEMSVFDAVPAPWFETPWSPAHSGFLGEDVAFCCKLAKAGIPVFIDHDLSKEIAHIGAFEYRHEHVDAVREAEAAHEPAPLVTLR